MKLFTSPTSPYARLVRVTLIEKHLQDRVDYRFVDPWASPAELLAVNTNCRVPTLVMPSGQVLTEAGVIVLFLERRYPEPRLMPRDAVERVHARLGQALGCVDAGVGVITERRYGDPDTPLARRRFEALRRATDSVADDVDPGASAQDPDLGDLAAALALDWVRFRFGAEVPWRDRQPAVGDWLDQLLGRMSFAATTPPDA
ncbi:glutathione S-transferase family protein [Spiribacter vilamensis]|uniref:Glutathione S-transferase n=1 Tax=Spiribacter vilamensis TaxID=531306 RepID=A0A4V2GJB5_9GAMM|nr:glutathione S-transferase N-terminal domain-containing protein [Spiribacter vilamensis]RZU99655.1 glutathione S-transferase [Spiribacter vilamensis]TVO61389.1 hypothetical protein FPL09_04485 [Spiribacter vilamensis]